MLFWAITDHSLVSLSLLLFEGKQITQMKQLCKNNFEVLDHKLDSCGWSIVYNCNCVDTAVETF